MQEHSWAVERDCVCYKVVKIFPEIIMEGVKCPLREFPGLFRS